MNVGIIGSGKEALGELWAAGHQVMFSFSRSPERLQTLATRIGMSDEWNTRRSGKFCRCGVVCSYFLACAEAILSWISRRQGVIDTTNPTAGLRAVALSA